MTVVGYAPIGRTLAELIAETEEHLGKSRHQLNKLTADITPTDTTLTFTFDAGGLRHGAYIEIGDEVLYVWSITGQVATVERGQLSTTPAAHSATAIIRVNPRFLRVSILRALREEIAAWPRIIYPVLQGTYEVAVDVTSIDLDGVPPNSRALRLLKVWRQQSHTTENPTRWPTINYMTLEPAANPVAFPSGWRLVWPKHFTASTMQVAIGGNFLTGAFTSTTDLGTIGLTDTMADIAPIGAAARLLMPREITRTDDAALGRSRLAEEVPPGYTGRTAEDLFQWRDVRIADEAKRLLSDYGWME